MNDELGGEGLGGGIMVVVIWRICCYGFVQ